MIQIEAGAVIVSRPDGSEAFNSGRRTLLVTDYRTGVITIPKYTGATYRYITADDELAAISPHANVVLGAVNVIQTGGTQYSATSPVQGWFSIGGSMIQHSASIYMLVDGISPEYVHYSSGQFTDFAGLMAWAFVAEGGFLKFRKNFYYPKWDAAHQLNFPLTLTYHCFCGTFDN